MKNIWKKIKQFFKDLFGGKEKDQSDKIVIEFIYGGFAGGNAIEDPEVQIGNFNMDSKHMTYKWIRNDMAKWGYNESDAKALACAFFYDEVSKKYLGGKFDWVSSNRTSRGWENIYSRYNGWNPNKFFSAKKHAFCIVSGDGRKRTNIITD